MSIPVDILLTKDKNFKVNGVGDLATTRDIVQDVVVRLFNEIAPSHGEGITAVFIREFESDIESALTDSPYVEGPYEVNVVDIQDGNLIVNVSTANMEFTESINTNE